MSVGWVVKINDFKEIINPGSTMVPTLDGNSDQVRTCRVISASSVKSDFSPFIINSMVPTIDPGQDLIPPKVPRVDTIGIQQMSL